MKSLGTHNLREATARRNQMNAEFERMVHDHRKVESDVSDSQQYRSLISMYVGASDDSLEAAYNKLTDRLQEVIGDKDIPINLDHLADKLPLMSQSERQLAVNEQQQKAYIEQLPNAEERVKAKALQNVYLGVRHDLAHHTINEALKQHVDDNGHKYKVNTLTQVKKSVSRFLEHLGKADVPLKDIGRRTVKTFITARLSDQAGSTVSAYVGYMSSIWQHADDLELTDGSNPFAGHKIDTSTTDSFQLFTDEELTAIFKSTEKFKGTKSDFKYILPRLAYVTGARIEELCQIKCEHIGTDETTGIDYFDIVDGKNKNAQRRIPLHDWMVDIVLEQKAKVGSGYLFPTLSNQRNDGKRSDAVSKWFGRLKKQIVKTEGKKGLHSFRVHMATNLERGLVLESTTVWVLGHKRSQSSSYGLYSKGPALRQLKEAVDVVPIDDAW